jgi:DNA-binding NarL/FixJ family response regulator
MSRGQFPDDVTPILRQLAAAGYGGCTVYVPKGRYTLSTDKIKELRSQGLSISQISQALNCSERAVYLHLSK